jgi:Domain of unknown function (DUF4260)
MVHGMVRTWLRVEGILVFAAGLALYAQAERGWLLFAALFLAPDVSFLGYLAGPRIGAAVYNLGHSYTLPLALALGALFMDLDTVVPFALIWIAHIGFDRALGYGLKYATGFGDTHLGGIGASRRAGFSPPAGAR